jgi:hypothetical protein
MADQTITFDTVCVCGSISKPKGGRFKPLPMRQEAIFASGGYVMVHFPSQRREGPARSQVL